MSRAQTLVLALLVLHVLLGVLCLLIARGEHKSSALRWWGCGLLVYSGGLVLTLPGVLPRPIGLTLGNGIIAIAPVITTQAVFTHARFRMNRAWVGAALAVTIGVLAFNNFGMPSIGLVNLIAPTPIAVVLYLVAAFVIVRDGPADARVACRFVAVMFVLAVLTWIARIAMTLAYVGGSGDIQRADLVISLFAIAQIVVGVGATLSLMWIDVRLMQAELSRVAHTDALTGLANRRAILLRFHEEAARAARRGEPFGLALFDLDHFKQVNDLHGHAGGDRVLVAAADMLRGAKRAEDVLGRLGGEEFLLLFPAQSREASREAAERLRERIAGTPVAFDGVRLQMTASGGIAMYPEDGTDWDSLYDAADKHLYESKRAGRNRISG